MLYEPKVPGDKDGKMFVGWFEDGSTSVFTGFGTVGTIKTDGEVVSLHATYANVSYVRNHDESGAVIESTKATEGSTVTVESDSLLIKCNQVAECQVDWKTAEGTAVVEKTGFSTIDPVEASMTVSGNVDLYPNVREGYWVSFDSKDGTPFSRQFIALDSADKTAKNPGMPILEGYTFVGWYSDEACADGNEYDFSTGVTQSMTLYAKWTPAGVAYSVDYYIEYESVVGSDPLQSTWSYKKIGREARTGTTGGLTGYDPDFIFRDPYGVSTNGYELNADKTGDEVAIAADGSTVRNVYHQCKTYNIVFRYPTNAAERAKCKTGASYGDGTVEYDGLNYSESLKNVIDKMKACESDDCHVYYNDDNTNGGYMVFYALGHEVVYGL